MLPRSAGHECVEQKLGQKVDAQVIERPRHLNAIGAQPPRHEEGADVVHQHVEAGMAALEFLGQAAHLGLSRQIGLHELHRRVAGLLPDTSRDRLAFVAISPDSYHRRPCRARPTTVAKPIPAVAPVTRQTFPDTPPSWDSWIHSFRCLCRSRCSSGTSIPSLSLGSSMGLDACRCSGTTPAQTGSA